MNVILPMGFFGSKFLKEQIACLTASKTCSQFLQIFGTLLLQIRNHETAEVFTKKNNGVTRILWRMVSWDKDREVLFASLSEFFANGVCRKTYYAHPDVLESFIVW
jgi:hypothetical protein